MSLSSLPSTISRRQKSLRRAIILPKPSMIGITTSHFIYMSSCLWTKSDWQVLFVEIWFFPTIAIKGNIVRNRECQRHKIIKSPAPPSLFYRWGWGDSERLRWPSSSEADLRLKARSSDFQLCHFLSWLAVSLFWHFKLSRLLSCYLK